MSQQVPSHLEHQVIDVHLLFLLHDVNYQTVDEVPLPLKSSRRVLVYIQVRLSGQQPHRRWDALQAVGCHLLI